MEYDGFIVASFYGRFYRNKWASYRVDLLINDESVDYASCSDEGGEWSFTVEGGREVTKGTVNVRAMLSGNGEGWYTFRYVTVYKIYAEVI